MNKSIGKRKLLVFIFMKFLNDVVFRNNKDKYYFTLSLIVQFISTIRMS